MKVVEKSEKQLAMHPQKFAMWLFMITVVMLFAALTSAYLVRQGEGNWMLYELPAELWYSSVILIFSSITIHWSYINAKHDNIEKLKTGMFLTTALGLVFLISQYYVWGILVDHEVYFVGNPSGSFLYVFMGIHALHLIGGIVFLLIMLRLAYNYEVHSKNLSRLEMCITYWHFLGGLWIYLFLFLLLNHN